MLNWGPEVKTIWGHSISEIISLINGQLFYLHGFTFLEIIFRYVPKWKVIGNKTPIQEITLRKIKELEEGADGLIIEKIVDRREEQQIFAVRSISENHTRHKRKTQVQWIKPQVKDLILV